MFVWLSVHTHVTACICVSVFVSVYVCWPSMISLRVWPFFKIISASDLLQFACPLIMSFSCSPLCGEGTVEQHVCMCVHAHMCAYSLKLS